MNKVHGSFIFGTICAVIGAVCFWGQFLAPQYALLIWGAGAVFFLIGFYLNWRSRQWWS